MAEAEKKLEAAQFEPRDISEGFAWGASAVCLALLLIAGGVVYWLYPNTAHDRVIHFPHADYPAPHLQSDPAADMRRMRAQELQLLNGTGWIDQEHRIGHIPIDRAMQEVAAEGIADWPVPP